MDKEKIKKKVKDFYEENKFLVGYAVGGIVAITGFDIGWKLMNRSYNKKGLTLAAIDSRIAEILFSASSKGDLGTFTGIADPGYAKEDLGKLAEFMNHVGVPSDIEFTHFIAMGKHK